MKRVVELLVTVRPGGRLPLSALTLRSLRVGFPTADVVVWGNDLGRGDSARLARATEAVGGIYRALPPQRHDHWLAWRIDQSPADELVILDGDLVFHRAVEDLRMSASLIGPREPAHFNPVTKARHAERLHTCFWRLYPGEVREMIADYQRNLPKLPHRAPWHPTAQVWIPGDPPQFYDTGATLHRVVFADHFGPEYADAFTHLHAGCWWHEAGAVPDSLADLKAVHDAAVAGELTPEDFATIRAQQLSWYAEHATPPQPCPTPPE